MTSPVRSAAQLTAQFGSEFAAAFELGRSLGSNVPEPSLTAIWAIGTGLLARRRLAHSGRVRMS